MLSTPPLTGAENMAYDTHTLLRMQSDEVDPVLRFFRWNRPTVSFGKHQRFNEIRPLIPEGWESIQRPTGGGIVYHDQDLCFSLCWRAGQPPLPQRLTDHYAWIHRIVMQAMTPLEDFRLATCRDCGTTATPFGTRDCFTQPVAFDLLKGAQKVLGGALCRKKNAFLYQGSIQGFDASLLEPRLQSAFQQSFDAVPSVSME